MQPETVTQHELTCQVIDHLAHVAAAKYPTTPDMDRIARGAALAKMGYVVLMDDGTAQVHSASAQKTYKVNGECQCLDQRAISGRCKHRYAKALLRRAETILGQARYAVIGESHGIAWPSEDMMSIEFLQDGEIHVSYCGPAAITLLGKVSPVGKIQGE